MGHFAFQAMLKLHLNWQLHPLNPNGPTLNLLDYSLGHVRGQGLSYHGRHKRKWTYLQTKIKISCLAFELRVWEFFSRVFYSITRTYNLSARKIHYLSFSPIDRFKIFNFVSEILSFSQFLIFWNLKRLLWALKGLSVHFNLVGVRGSEWIS